MRKPPEPERKRAILVNARGNPTRHVFVKSQITDLPFGRGWEFIFECLDTGAQRRYGCEPLGTEPNREDDETPEVSA